MKSALIRFLPLLLCLSGLFAQNTAAQNEAVDAVFEEIRDILSELETITGLKAKTKIQYDRIDKEGVKKFLEEQVKIAVKPEELAAEEAVLKKFGLVPPDFSLAKATVDLLSEQAAAFYDFRKKKLFLITSSPPEILHISLVHELAHALADQHFNLEKFANSAKKNDDTSVAHLAVMEGQATWLMAECMARKMHLTLKKSSSLLNYVKQETESSTAQYPVFEKAPLYMRETLLFPYTQGLLFQQSVFLEMDQEAFTKVFRDPPVSSQQILHPEKYLSRVQPAVPALPDLTTRKSYRKLAEGTVGELDHSILLRQYTSKEDSEAVSPKWQGGTYLLLENKKDRSTVLCYASQWDTEETSRRYFELYQRVLKGKWKTFEVASDSGDAIAGRGDDGYFVLRRNGARVISVEGMKSVDDLEPDKPETAKRELN